MSNSVLQLTNIETHKYIEYNINISLIGGNNMDYKMEAQTYLLEARGGQTTSNILHATQNLEKVLYEQRLNPTEIGTNYSEIRGISKKAYKHECLHWLRILRRKNSLSVIQKFENLRIAGKLSYADLGTSRIEIITRKIIARFRPQKTVIYKAHH